ncbi:MAG: XcyI family restriction endonuclease [Rhodobacteraceae bacterium]|nr:XcyI family restriction endonuclease [Paracoccaceae bacterium]
MTDDAVRSRLLSGLLQQRKDMLQRRIIDGVDVELHFDPPDRFMISQSAWNHVQSLDIVPKIVFAHPEIISAYPTTSLYYRGMSLLSRKRVQQMAGTSVAPWEDGRQKKPVEPEKAGKVACLYNCMISSIIEGSSDWTLDNGYRNILATMGIMYDGMFRNRIGKIVETAIKDRIVSWVKAKGIVSEDAPDIGSYRFRDGTIMNFGAEPDIEFVRDDQTIATIEIKGGRDPAGALERLGAMRKSFEETPKGCINFLVAGVITPEMRVRLEKMGVVKVYLFDDISRNKKSWEEFAKEVFHYTIRVI